MSAISYDLKDRAINHEYKFTTFTIGGCFYVPGYEIIDRKTKIHNNRCKNYNNAVKKKLLQTNNQIIIIGASFPIYFSGEQLNFENNEYLLKKWSGSFSPTSDDKNMLESFKKFLIELSKKNQVILIYPIPEVGWYPLKRLLKVLPKNFLEQKRFLNNKKNYLTTPYQLYLKRNNKIIQKFDQINDKNIYKVYPNKLFCNIDILKECLVHTNREIYYIDQTHPSIEGSKLINDEILKIIRDIDLNHR
jgi:hypothetical protein